MGKDEEEDEEEESDYEDEEEEDVDLGSDFEEEEAVDEEEEQEQEAKMPPKRKTKTPTKSPARKKSEDDVVLEDVTGAVKNMSLSRPSARASMNATYPFFLYSYAVDRRDHVRVDFFIPTLTQDYFLPRIDKDAPDVLLLTTFIPEMFPSVARLDEAHGGDDGFNADTHMNTAYKKLANATKDKYDNDVNPDIVYSSEPQKVELPFACEDEIAFEVQYHPNDNDDLTDALGGVQYHAVLSVIARAIHKPKQRVAGGIRVVGGGAQQQQHAAPNAP